MGEPANTNAALVEYAAWVRGAYGARLRKLVLFGSHARKEAREDSDVDVLVVIDALTSAEAREVAQAAGDILTNHGVLISPLVLSTERYDDLVSRERLIVREIARDGVPL